MADNLLSKILHIYYMITYMLENKNLLYHL